VRIRVGGHRTRDGAQVQPVARRGTDGVCAARATGSLGGFPTAVVHH
jgi:hypothetical protein